MFFDCLKLFGQPLFAEIAQFPNLNTKKILVSEMGNWVSQKVLTKASKKCWGNKIKITGTIDKEFVPQRIFQVVPLIWKKKFPVPLEMCKLSRKPPKSTFCLAIVNFFSQITFKFVLWRVTFISRPVMHFFASRLGGGSGEREIS